MMACVHALLTDRRGAAMTTALRNGKCEVLSDDSQFLFSRLGPSADALPALFGRPAPAPPPAPAVNRLAHARALREEGDRSSMFDEIVGSSPALGAVLAHLS